MNNGIDGFLGLLGEAFQLSVLKAIIEDPIFFNRIRDVLKADFFSLEYIRICYTLIDEYFVKYHLVPDYQMLETLVKGNLIRREFERDRILKELYKIRLQPQKNLHYVKEKIVDFCRMQAFQLATRESISLLESLQKNPGQSEISYESIIDLFKSIKKIDLEVIDGDLFENLEELYREGTHRKNIIHTNSRMLNHVLGGGAASGEVHCIGAFTNIGKTTYAIDIGSAAFFQKFKVLHFTLENTKRQVKAGYHSRLIERPRNKLRESIDLLKNTCEQYSPAKIEIVQLGKKKHTITTIENFYNRYLDQGFEPNLIIIDSPSHLIPARYSEKDNANIARVWEDTETFAKEIDLPIWGTAQLNRGAADKRENGTETVGEAIQISQVAASFTTLNQKKEDKKSRIIYMHNAKTREAAPGEIWKCKVIGSIGKFIEFRTEVDQRIAELIAETNRIEQVNEQEVLNEKDK